LIITDKTVEVINLI